jgi:hypothetical protein
VEDGWPKVWEAKFKCTVRVFGLGWGLRTCIYLRCRRDGEVGVLGSIDGLQ